MLLPSLKCCWSGVRGAPLVQMSAAQAPRPGPWAALMAPQLQKIPAQRGKKLSGAFGPALGWGPTWDNLRVGVPCLASQAGSTIWDICALLAKQDHRKSKAKAQTTIQSKITSTTNSFIQENLHLSTGSFGPTLASLALT